MYNNMNDKIKIQTRYNENAFAMYLKINNALNIEDNINNFYISVKEIMSQYHASFNNFIESLDSKESHPPTPSAPYDPNYLLALAEYYNKPSYFTQFENQKPIPTDKTMDLQKSKEKR